MINVFNNENTDYYITLIPHVVYNGNETGSY